jgi:hypothetical protein
MRSGENNTYLPEYFDNGFTKLLHSPIRPSIKKIIPMISAPTPTGPLLPR